MGFLSSFVGGMARAYNDDRDAEKLDARKRAMAEYENELQTKRLMVAETLREKFKQAEAKAKRDQDMADGKTVRSASNDKRVERAQGIINADTGIQHTPDEVKRIIADPTWVENYGAVHQTADGKPTEWTGGGLINQRTGIVPSSDRTPYQEQMDLSNAAGDIGRTDMQAKYTQSADNDRRYSADEAKGKRMDEQTAAQIAETARKEKADRGREAASADKTNAILAKIGAKGEKDNSPAEVRAVQWYMDNQDDPEAMAAWNKVHESKSKNIISVAAGLLAQIDPMTGASKFTVEQAYKQASDLYDLAASKNRAAPGNPAPEPDPSKQAQDDARRAVATGRISKEEANKRLKNAGFGTI